jgi:hypothetical protein
MSEPGKKVSWVFLSLSLFFSFSQQAEDSISQNQTLQNPGLLAHGKPPHAAPH